MYETDPDSPYREIRPITQKTYSKMLRLFLARIEDANVSTLTGADVKRWFKRMCETRSVGYAALNISILKTVISYGAALGLKECAQLRGQISAARFKAGRPRKERLTYAQLVAFRHVAHRLGRPSAALWLTLQYELALRRRDVIGEWIDGQWRDGLTWSDIKDGVLRKVVSKTALTSAKEAVHRIANYPELVAELERVPRERRVGPLVINEATGKPYKPEQCRYYFRLIARAAGIPDSIWNMDARAGAVTEAYEAGATTEGAMSFAAHSEVSTSRRYLRDTVEQNERVAQLRIIKRQKDQ
jgi:hypothetical protein